MARRKQRAKRRQLANGTAQFEKIEYTPTRIELKLDGRTAPESWPSVSLCMIVKNEAKNLAACLESVGDFAAEVIVVDTGSTDGTVEVAKSLGARVKHFDWIDDFAAARNESIRHAQGDWIFWMDADDRISAENLVRLKNAVASNQADGYFCSITSRHTGAEAGTRRLPHFRLFRNRAGIQFERPLHEDAAPSAERLGLTLALTNIEIEHTGYAASETALRAKAARNLPIIERALAQSPGDLFWRYHLGVTAALLGRTAEAVEHCAAVAANPPATLDREINLYNAHQTLIVGQMQLKRFDDARQSLARAQSEFAHRQHIWILAAAVHLALNAPQAALDALA
ncbi:MAG: glycosyltransferase, partial [Chloroflexi bacterium]